jgi:hypothetical protein
MAPAQDETLANAPCEMPWQPISDLEVFRSLKAAKSSTAPGEDGLPTLVWKRLWTYIGNTITRIFTASIDLGYQKMEERPDRGAAEAWKTGLLAPRRVPPNFIAQHAWQVVGGGDGPETVLLRNMDYCPTLSLGDARDV